MALTIFRPFFGSSPILGEMFEGGMVFPIFCLIVFDGFHVCFYVFVLWYTGPLVL